MPHTEPHAYNLTARELITRLEGLIAQHGDDMKIFCGTWINYAHAAPDSVPPYVVLS